MNCKYRPSQSEQKFMCKEACNVNMSLQNTPRRKERKTNLNFDPPQKRKKERNQITEIYAQKPQLLREME